MAVTRFSFQIDCGARHLLALGNPDLARKSLAQINILAFLEEVQKIAGQNQRVHEQTVNQGRFSRDKLVEELILKISDLIR
jgi:hypothetical protein